MHFTLNFFFKKHLKLESLTEWKSEILKGKRCKTGHLAAVGFAFRDQLPKSSDSNNTKLKY